MSREIKFRAWDLDEKKYHYDICIKPLGEVIALELYDGEMLPIRTRCLVEQYTGLKDKNGKEIYEGDIMRYDAIDYQVLWSDYYASFETKRINSEFLNEGLTLHFLARVGRVIGNIHENAELLEAQK